MMKTLRIALLQLLLGESLEENLEIGSAACRRARELGADIALFPEMWSCGYHIPEDVERLKSMALSLDHPFVAAFGNLSRELDMAICVTILESQTPETRPFSLTGTESENLSMPRSTPAILERKRDFAGEIRLTLLSWTRRQERCRQAS